MPFAEFQPSTVGFQENQNLLANVDFGGSLMERAQRMAVERQKLDIEKQQLASNLALQTQQVEQSRASVANLEAQTTAQNIENGLKRTSATLQQKLLGQVSAAFDSDNAPATPPAESLQGSPQVTGNFTADVQALQGMPLNTPSDLVNYQAYLSGINSRYGALASASPTAKALFDAVLGRVQAPFAHASALMAGRAAILSRVLSPELAAVSSKEEFDAYTAKHGDQHQIAMMNPEYAALVSKIADQNASASRERANMLARTNQSFENEQKLLKQKSTVDVGGFSGVAPTPEAAQKVRDGYSVYKPSVDAIDALDNLLTQVKGSPSDKISPAVRAEGELFQQQLVSAIGRMQTGGVLSDAEAEQMRKLVPNPADLTRFDSATEARLKTLRHELNVRMESLALANGVSRTGAAPKAAEGPVAGQPGTLSIKGQKVSGVWRQMSNGRLYLVDPTHPEVGYPAQ